MPSLRDIRFVGSSYRDPMVTPVAVREMTGFVLDTDRNKALAKKCTMVYFWGSGDSRGTPS